MYGQGENLGLYMLAAQDIFTKLQMRQYAHLEIYVSFFEIYGGKVFDLLNSRTHLRCLEDSNKMVQIVGLREQVCNMMNLSLMFF